MRQIKHGWYCCFQYLDSNSNVVSFRFDELPKDDEKWGFVELSKWALDLLKECKKLCKGIMAMGKTIERTKTTMASTTTSLFVDFFGNNSI
jgi:hypothetical protein